MRKNELIKLLQQLDGNPEILLWNGYVGDYMHISNLVENELVKQTFDHYAKMVEFEEKRNRKDWDYQHTEQDVGELKGCYKKFVEWEINEYVTAEDIENKRYKKKRVVFIGAKPRGKTSYDRLGGVEY